ncbi:PLP-dependent aminotransferase family protein [Zobellella iuensis]|jgi:GntR family transcriptional regulator/MocR family aminotransferase|uniref:PLP-dependent aminotransferase family protein n=1 Tax=Zobellella iuensis TaxID=2803811 RepID=A0ABS1QNR0_9GAMM|nr:PLP-dependent aminotransferase family protein [Zobellella iuensis]MBL1376490.1 PLP-dependent aminotransferase family protein [Zobellella iuensis]
MSALFHLDRNAPATLQQQVREHLVSAILGGFLPHNQPLPSCRHLAKSLNVARNTIVLVYDDLVSDGYLTSHERRGYFVNPHFVANRLASPTSEPSTPPAPHWERRLKLRPGQQPNASLSHDWQRYRYPFVYSQLDSSLFPVQHWRKCWRDAVSVQAIKDWGSDRYDSDDPLLIEQLQKRILPSRGIQASAEEILITVGSQQALYLLAQLLLDGQSCFGIEDPGYPSAAHIARLFGARVQSLAVDEQGLVVNETLSSCDAIYLTPSHQCPTTVTLPLERRQALLELAEQHDFLLIEDDYEMEMNFDSHPTPALKSLDNKGRVLYVGSLSKTLAPGLRMGFLVAPEPVIQEARNLRQLMLRHPPLNNQRAVALFLSLGYHDALVRKLAQVFEQRARCLADALQQHLPDCRVSSIGGSSCWLTLPENLDGTALKRLAAEHNLLIISGDSYHIGNGLPANTLKLGFSAIPLERIEPGIRLLGELKAKLDAGRNHGSRVRAGDRKKTGN